MMFSGLLFPTHINSPSYSVRGAAIQDPGGHAYYTPDSSRGGGRGGSPERGASSPATCRPPYHVTHTPDAQPWPAAGGLVTHITHSLHPAQRTAGLGWGPALCPKATGGKVRHGPHLLQRLPRTPLCVQCPACPTHLHPRPSPSAARRHPEQNDCLPRCTHLVICDRSPQRLAHPWPSHTSTMQEQAQAPPPDGEGACLQENAVS